MIEKIRKHAGPPTPEKAAAITAWLEEKKAADLLALDLSAQSAFTEGLILASAASVRHAQGMADFILERCNAAKYEYLRMEGYQAGRWILLDLNDIVVCLFQQEERRLYALEELWPKAPVLYGSRRNGMPGREPEPTLV